MAFKSAVALALFFLLSLSAHSIYIAIDDSLHYAGEEVPLQLNQSLDDGFRIDISDGSSVFSYLGDRKNFTFIPKNEGAFSASIVDLSGQVYELLNFTIQRPSQNFVFTDKKEYILGESVLIYLDKNFQGSDTNITISSEDEIFFFLGEVTSSLKFSPIRVGNYQIFASKDQNVATYNFTVLHHSSTKPRGSFSITSGKNEYALGEKVILEALFPPNETFDFYIKASENVYRFFGIPDNYLTFIPKEPGTYEATIEKSEMVLASFKFRVGRPSLNASYFEDLLNNSFSLDQDAVIEIDFAPKISAVRNTLELSLKNTLLSEVTAFIEDYHDNPNFALSLEHLEFDKFRVKVSSNPSVKEGVYTLVAAGRYKEDVYRIKIPFNWGQGNRTLVEALLSKKLDKDIYIEKNIFLLGELIDIKTNLSDLQVSYDNITINISSGLVPHIAFAPLVEGTYEIKAQNAPFSAVKFHVSGSASKGSFSQDLVQNDAVVGEPVKWTKKIKLSQEDSDSIVLFDKIFSKGENLSMSIDDYTKIEYSNDTIITVNENLMPFEEKDIELSFFTQGVGKNEFINETQKKAEKLISLYDDGIIYDNIKASTQIYESKPQQVRLILEQNNSLIDITNQEQFNASLTDTNNDGYVDRLSWVAPDSGHKNFKVIVSKAAELTLDIKDSSNKTINAEFELYSDNKLERSTETKFNELINLSKENDLVIKPLNSSIKTLLINNIEELDDANKSIGIDEIPKDKDSFRAWEKIYAIDPRISFENGTVTSTAKAKELYKCKEWNFEQQTCNGNWEKIMDLVPGKDYNITIFDGDPAFAESNLTILNVQSYPVIGGLWVVRFNTTGIANLTITASKGTTWSNSNNNFDLRFLELRCGDEILDYDWIDQGAENSVFVKDYSCDSIGTETSLVLTPGKHTIKFQFANAIEYANNLATIFVDNTDTDFNGTRHMVNITGSGANANVSLNFTTNSSVRIYNTSGNYTSRIFDSGSTFAVFDTISWTAYLKNSSDVLGFAAHGAADDGAVFYRNGSFGRDSGQTNFNGDPPFTAELRRYTIPSDLRYSDIIGFAFDADSDDVYAFLMNGSTISDTSQADLSTDISFSNGFSTWSIPSGFSRSDVIGFAIDDDNTAAAVFFKNLSYVVAGSEAPSFTFSTIRAFTIASGFSIDDAIGATYHSAANDVALFFRNGTMLSDTAQTDFTSNVDFATQFIASYQSDVNLTAYSNITFQTRVSNDTIIFTPWSLVYSNTNQSQKIIGGNGQYIQYKTMLFSPDKFIAPSLENVTINFTIDSAVPAISNFSPLNKSYIQNPVNISFNTDEYATCKYNNSNSTFNYTTGGTLFSNTNALKHSSSLSLSEGFYNYYVKCQDEVGNTNNDSNVGAIAFTVDNTDPNITLSFPSSGLNLTQKSINFTWLARDNLDINITCNLTLDGSLIAQNITSLNDTLVGYQFDVSEGSHKWNVSCGDRAGNYNYSQNLQFSYSQRKSIVSIQTQNSSYKQNKEILLFSPTRDERGDQESGTQQALAKEKNYEIIFENFDSSDWTTISGANPTAGCSGGYGEFSNCNDNSDDYRFGKTSGGTHISDGYMLDLQDWDNFDANLGIWEAFSPQTACNGTCRDIYVSGYVAASSLDNGNEFCIVWAINNSATSALTIALCENGEADCEFSETGNALTSSTSDFKFFNATLIKNISLDISKTTNLEIHIGADESGAQDDCFYEDINVTGFGWEWESNSTAVTYSNIGGSNYQKISDIDINIEVRLYNASGSRNVSNNYPDIKVLLYNGTDFGYSYLCNLTSFYGNGSKTSYNCSNKVKESSVLSSWRWSSNRSLKVQGAFLDSTPYWNDTVNWTGVYVEIETPSKIENYGSGNISGTVVMQIQNSSNDVLFSAYSELHTISINSTLNLSALWTIPWNSGSSQLGNYTARVSVVNSSSEVLVNADGTYLNDSYTFLLDYLRLAFQSPTNMSSHDATGFFANITQNYLSYPSGGNCEYEIDSGKKYQPFNNTIGGNFSETEGDYKNLSHPDNTSKWYVGEAGDGPYVVNANMTINFRISSFTRLEYLQNITLNLSYCHTAKIGGFVRCNGSSPTGIVASDNNVSIFNYSAQKWASIGALRTNSNGNLLFDYYYPNGTLSDFVNSTDYNIRFRVRPRLNNTLSTDSTYLVLDYASMIIKSRIPMLNGSPTYYFNFTTAIEEADHNITAFCNDTQGDVSSVTSTFSAVDITPPTVNLSLPIDNDELANGNVTFAYNVSDSVSTIANCTLEFMFSDNQTNITIIENANQSFKIFNLDNGGPYSWRVRCFDNSSSKNEGNSSYYDFLVGSDTDVPVVTLREPIDLYNTTSNDVTFSYRVNDLTSTIRNCSLVLNNQTNKTNTTITEQGAFPFVFNNFTVFDMPDGNYTWNINCTDNSNNRNIGNSSTRSLKVSRDLSTPVITLISPDNNAIDTDGAITFSYNVSDASSNILNCSLIINKSVNLSVKNPSEGLNTFTPTSFRQGYYNWSINCTDDSFDLNYNYSEVRNFTVNIISSMRLSIGTSKTFYEQGTSANESADISTNTSDAFDARINTSATIDIIAGNTTLRWWDQSWKRRKPIFINETNGQGRTSEAIIVNITNLNGYITNCINEIRIIRNESVALSEIESNVLDGDNSNWCAVKFKATISASANSSNDYYAYYNNSGAVNPNYARINDLYNRTLMFDSFEGSNWDVISDEDPGNGCASGSGTNFNNCDDNSDDYDFAATTGATAVSGSRILVMEDLDGWFANSSLFFRIDPRTACEGACEDVRVTGYMASGSLDSSSEYCRIWTRIINTTAYTTITECVGADPACEFTDDSNTLPSAVSDYEFFNASLFANFSLNVKSSNYTSIHIGGQIPGADEHCYYENIKIEGIKNSTFNVTTSAGDYQELINSSTNDTGNSGGFTAYRSTSGLSTGLYSVTSFSYASGYTNRTNATYFYIRTDTTAPTVNLKSPTPSATNDTDTIFFFYNVSDTLSGILNCTLIINGTINVTNVSVAEDTTLNFTVAGFSNKLYQWNVNCTDDSSNKNKGEASARLFSIAVDSTPPVVTSLMPQNNYTDTNRNVTFNYTVTDDLTSTADCSLYINGTVNTTQENVPTDGSTLAFSNITLFNNNTFSWYVNCTDDSIARNFNFSANRNFTVIEDLEAPNLTLIYPPHLGQVTNENVTFIYNVTDSLNISSCSLSINGSLNQTNFTVTRGILQNFTVFNLNGNYNWSINCTDSSENKNTINSTTRDLLVAADNDGPEIELVFPPNNIELSSDNITFIFNVTDLASGIRNCSLYINRTLNRTDTTITENTAQNFTQNLTDGFYSWHVNCTDNSANFNFGVSETRNFTIGVDRTAPIVTIFEPIQPYVDTNGILFFNYTVNDIASNIANCSLAINNTINITNNSVTKLVTSNFSQFGFKNGTYSWQVNCTDNSSIPNTGNSSSREFIVYQDFELPIVKLVLPANQTIDTDGRRTFSYNVSDSITDITNCSLIINGRLNVTNTTVTENARQNFTLTGLEDGDYNWTVNCTDTSENKNLGETEFRVITVQNDNGAPSISLLGPTTNTLDTNGIVTFNYTVTDALSGIASCTLKVGSNQYVNTSIAQGITQQFNITGLTDGDYFWNVSCIDDSENSNSGISSPSRNISIVIDNSAPVVTLVSPEDNTQELSNNVTFFYNVTDAVDVTNCSLIVNGTINQSNSTPITKGKLLNFSAPEMANGTFRWQVNCTDSSESKLTGESESRIVVVGPDVGGPVVNLVNPPNNVQDIDGNLTFEYNVSDLASGIANCSLIINGTINQTSQRPQEDTKLNFTLNDTPIGDYIWQVNCTDNFTASNKGSSEIRNISVGLDTTPPTVTLTSPLNNSIANVFDLSLEYSVIDFASNISNCTLILNGNVNITNHSISEAQTNQFFIPEVIDGNYNWSVRCTDGSNNSNVGNSSVFNFSVFRPKQILADVYTNQSSYEQGSYALITANATNSSLDPFDASAIVDIIMGNTSAPFFDAGWAYRIPVEVNTSNITRKSQLITLQINFSKTLIDELGASGKTFEYDSIRLIEWKNNRSYEMPFQFENGTEFNTKNNSYGTIYWVLNGTTQSQSARSFFIYFDISENGQKRPADFGSKYPSFSFIGSGRSVKYDGTSSSASHLRIYGGTESITIQFDNGNSISNQQNIEFQGAGSIWNLTADSTRLSNYYDSIIPVAIYNEYFMHLNTTANVTSGPVVTKIRIPGRLNSTLNSESDLNYTIWFADKEIIIKADLSVIFNQANTDPQSLFNNLWFAYMFDYDSDWNSFIRNFNSTNYNNVHRWHAPTSDLDTTNQFNEGDWYSEHTASRGSVNVYLQKFILNGASSTKGLITYDDWYNPAQSKTTESDAAGFNFNSDQTIASGDTYSLTAWIIISANKTSLRAAELKDAIDWPINITIAKGQLLVNRTISSTETDGIFSFNWSTSNRPSGNYTTTIIANKSLYTHGVDFWNFLIQPDTTTPVVGLKTANNTWFPYANITLTYNVSDSNLISNCSLIINTRLNRTEYSIINNADNIISINNTAQGFYNWSVNCTDSSGNIANSTTRQFTVDTTNPTLALNGPANNTLYNYTNLEFNFTATDNLDNNLSCNITIDGNLAASVNASSSELTRRNITVTQAQHEWYVSCTDDASNLNTSISWLFTVDLGAPSIALNRPANNSHTKFSNITFFFTPNDLTLDNCSIIINGAVNKTNLSPETGAENNFIIENISEGKAQWAINCTDTIAQSGTSVSSFVFVDLTPPSIALSNPSGFAFNKSAIQLNFTPLDNLAQFLTCNLTINGTVNNSDALNAVNNSQFAYNSSGLIDGNFLWNVTCSDIANNTNISITRIFTINESPSVALIAPANNTRTNSPLSNFTFRPKDNSGSISNCTIILNGKANISNNSITEGIDNNITVRNIEHGQYNWSANCTDARSNVGTNLTPYLLYIDRAGPSITLNLPQQGQAFNTDDIDFNFTATDQFGFAVSLECNISLDGSVNVSGITVQSGADNVTQIQNLSQGFHNWNVTCKDDFNNTNSSATQSFVVNSPDLRINISDVYFNNTNPNMNDSILVNTTIYNIGGIAAENFTVLFYDKGSLFENDTISILNPGGNVTVNATLNSTLGLHEIFINVDYRSIELSKENNNATNNLTALYPLISAPPNGTWTSNSTHAINFSITDFVNNSFNYTLYLDGVLNRTSFNLSDNVTTQAEFNLSEGIHNVILEALGPRVDFHGKNSSLYRRKNSTNSYVNIDYTAPIAQFETANNSWFSDQTPEIRFNITDNMDSILNYTVFIKFVANQTNFTQNGTSRSLNLSTLGDGSYNLSIEAFDEAGNKRNSSFITVYIDTQAPTSKILTTNNSNFSDSTPEIQFNITDNLADPINFSFFVDGSASTNGSAQNGINRSANLTSIADGYKVVILQATDLAGNKANSSFINITIDTTAPVISVEYPLEAQPVGYTIGLLATITDATIGVNSARYTLINDSGIEFQNGTLNASTNFDDIWDSTLNISENVDFMYINFSITANDTLGNTRNFVRRFLIDNKRPSITFVYPNAQDLNKNFNLDIRIVNRNLTTSTYNITNSSYEWLANNSNITIFSTALNWSDLINISNITKYPEGVYNITAYAVDDVGNNRTAYSTFRVDRTYPNATLNYPIDLFNTSSSAIEFNFTVIDNFDLHLSCNLSIDDIVTVQDINATNNTITNVTVSSIAEGTHAWNVSCEDNAGNKNVSASRIFTIDQSSPRISLGRPTNNSFNNSASMIFFYTVNDSIDLRNCTLMLNGAANQSNSTIQNGIQNNFTITNLQESRYQWTVNCTDIVGNKGTNDSVMYLYIDNSVPNATFITNNGTWLNDPTPEIFFNITDNFDSELNYTIYVNNASDIIKHVANGTRASANLSSLSNGTHLIVIESYDNAYNRINSTNISIIIDTAAANITLLGPLNNSNISASDIVFFFNVSDNLDSELLCNITINGVVNRSYFPANNTKNSSISVNGFVTGFHNWSISCIDNASNIIVSNISHFNLTPPDIKVATSDIIFNVTEFEEGKNVTIFANISNTGRGQARDFLVQFFEGDPDSGGLQLSNNFSMNLTEGDSRRVNISWSFGIGTSNIFVQADRNNLVQEINESNNKANISINISAYNIIFGNITGNLILGSIGNRTVFSWEISNSSAGSVFVIDSDSVVAWTNLSALGINITSENSTYDFEELDLAINMTNLSDSINRTYSFNNLPKQTTTFTVFASSINLTPFVNSTNTSSFLTGILWDKSDSNPGQYNGSQDIVFLSNINRLNEGKYGIYDFEIKVPARLRQYKIPNNLNSITFYVELK